MLTVPFLLPFPVDSLPSKLREIFPVWQGFGQTSSFRFGAAISPAASGIGFPITGLIIGDPMKAELYQVPE